MVLVSALGSTEWSREFKVRHFNRRVLGNGEQQGHLNGSHAGRSKQFESVLDEH
jgi:hypothetical protein